MEVSFNSKNLRNICESANKLEDLFSNDANHLKNRISDLFAFNNMNDFAQFYNRIVKKIRAETTEMYQVSFGEKSYILIESSHIKNPTDNQGCIDWKSVSRIKIVSIGEIK